MTNQSHEHLLERLEAMVDLDRIMGDMIPTGSSITTDGGAAQPYVLEMQFLARRTFGTIRLIMDWSINSDDTDRTEDAAVLLRRLLEIYASLAFVIAEPPGDRDANALRCELSAAREIVKAIDAAITADGSTEAVINNKAEWEAAIDDISAALTRRTGAAKGKRSTTDILRDVDSHYELLWRQASDVAHGGVVGRALQREGVTLGIPATDDRRLFVLDTAIAVMGDTARCFGIVLGLDVGAIEVFADSRRDTAVGGNSIGSAQP